MNWLNRESLTLVGAVLISILIGLFPQYQPNIVEVIEAIVRLLIVILFPEAAVRGFRVYQEAKIQIAQVQYLGRAVMNANEARSADAEFNYNTADRT